MRQTKNDTKIELNKVYNESCLETLKKMKDGSIDAVITSPPYNMNLRIRNGKYEFLVRWLDYGEDYDTWEPYSGLKHLRIVKKYIKIFVSSKNEV